MTYDLVWADHNHLSYRDRPRCADFGFGWGSMRWLIPAMLDLGMVFDAGYDWNKAWPKTDGFPASEWDQEDPVQWSPARQAYERTKREILEKRFEHPGIPLHKFDTNDPWRIWPDEITSALQRYAERADGYAWKEDWHTRTMAEFVGYLLLSVEHGGVIVH